MKHCKACDSDKEDSDFHPSTKSSDGLWYRCKACRAVADKIVKLRRYGLTQRQYAAILESQRGRCGICGDPPEEGKFLSIDHDHRCCPGNANSCGKCVRGLLCSNCNLGIGYLRDSAQILSSASDYLEHGRIDTWLMLEKD